MSGEEREKSSIRLLGRQPVQPCKNFDFTLSKTLRMKGRLHGCVTSVVTQSPMLRRALHWLIGYYEPTVATILKFLMILSLNLCCVAEVLLDNGGCSREVIHRASAYSESPASVSSPALQDGFLAPCSLAPGTQRLGQPSLPCSHQETDAGLCLASDLGQ